jgi:hypothetical protein
LRITVITLPGIHLQRQRLAPDLRRPGPSLTFMPNRGLNRGPAGAGAKFLVKSTSLVWGVSRSYQDGYSACNCPQEADFRNPMRTRRPSAALLTSIRRGHLDIVARDEGNEDSAYPRPGSRASTSAELLQATCMGRLSDCTVFLVELADVFVAGRHTNLPSCYQCGELQP